MSKKQMKDAEKRQRFEVVRDEIAELAKQFPEGMVVIGGYAVYLHTLETKGSLELTGDGDVVFALDAYSRLKTIRAVSDNPRLQKHEFKRENVGFDVYVEYEPSNLPVPYAELASRAVTIQGIRCASLDDLLILKTKAAIDRQSSEHGEKDKRDIVKLMLMLRSPDVKVLAKYLDAEKVEFLDEIWRDQQIMSDVADGNDHLAKGIRVDYGTHFGTIKNGIAKLRGNSR